MRKHQKGFTLLEIMIVIAIVAVIVQMGVPRYQAYQANNKRRTAIATLQNIYALFREKFIEDNSFSSGITANAAQSIYGRSNCDFTQGWADVVGFSIRPCNANRASNLPPYNYSVSNLSQATFVANAYGMDPAVIRNNQHDRLSINQNRNLDITCDIVGGGACSDPNPPEPGLDPNNPGGGGDGGSDPYVNIGT